MKIKTKIITSAFYTATFLWINPVSADLTPSTDATSQSAVSSKKAIIDSTIRACEKDYRGIVDFEIRKRDKLMGTVQKDRDLTPIYEEFKAKSLLLKTKKVAQEASLKNHLNQETATFKTDLNTYRATCKEIEELKTQIEQNFRVK